MKKYVFFDIDGTLLPEGEQVIPEENINAIKKLQEKGIEPFICTGRSYHNAKKFIEQSGVKSFVVSNGQEVNIEGKEIYSYDMNPEERREIIEELEKSGTNWGYETRHGVFLNEMEGVEEVYNLLKEYGVNDISIDSSHLAKGIKQMWAFGEKEKLDELEYKIQDKFKFFRWSPYSIEIVSLNESKGKGIIKVVETCSDDVISYGFGDGFNDVEMFEIVNISVAMGNARTEIKAVANFVTDRCTHSGIPNALKRLELL